eukprot:11176142-Lingulodinium_polyedra.AAC.1
MEDDGADEIDIDVSSDEGASNSDQEKWDTQAPLQGAPDASATATPRAWFRGLRTGMHNDTWTFILEQRRPFFSQALGQKHHKRQKQLCCILPPPPSTSIPGAPRHPCR